MISAFDYSVQPENYQQKREKSRKNEKKILHIWGLACYYYVNKIIAAAAACAGAFTEDKT